MTKRPRRLQLERLEGRQLMATFAQAEFGIDLDGGVLAPPEPPPPGPIHVVQELPLRSLPGAPATLFLDFNGHFQEENVGGLDVPVIGGNIGGWSNFSVPAYDRDGDPLFFSPAEQDEIRFIWSVVAEDYAPFNINVTTVDPDPGLLHPERPYLRVVMSGGSDIRSGENAGGFAAYDAYAEGDEPNVAFVFLKNKSTGALRNLEFIANAASHEAGHAFGLDHYDSGTGNAKKAPIMESDGPFPSERGTWWSDDMDFIASDDNGFGYRPDDHAGGTWNPSGLTITSNGLWGRGVIERTNDVDTFAFTTGGGNVSIWVDEALQPGHGSVGNLDAVLRLLDANGTLIAQDNDPDLIWASVERTLAAGTYFIQVGSNGAAGDVGQYTVKVFEDTGPRVVTSQFLPTTSTQGALLVTFNEPINPLTFSIHDVRINGGLAGAGVDGVTPVDSKTFLITYTKPYTITGKYSLAIGPKIADFFGNGMDQNQNGLQGSEEPLDYYTATFWGGLGVYDPGYTLPTKTRTTLTATAVDAYFAKY